MFSHSVSLTLYPPQKYAEKIHFSLHNKQQTTIILFVIIVITRNTPNAESVKEISCYWMSRHRVSLFALSILLAFLTHILRNKTIKTF